MRSYLSIFKARLSVLFQYRAAAFAGICTQLFWGLVKVMILTAFYAQATTPQPIILGQAIAFIWIGQSLLQLLPWNIDKEIEAQVRNGNVAYELVRPLDLYFLWFFRAMAMRIVPTFIRSTPLFVFALLFFGLSLPVSVWAAVAFCVSVCLAVFLSTAITTLVIISLFWTLSGEGILRLLPHIVLVLSGLVVPLPLFPNWMQTFLDWQPFRGIVDIPSRLYTGVIPVNEAFIYFGFQLMWIVVIIVLGRFLMKRAVNQFVIEGG